MVKKNSGSVPAQNSANFEKRFREFLAEQKHEQAQRLIDNSNFDDKHRAFHQSRLWLEQGLYRDLIQLLKPFLSNIDAPDNSPGMLQLVGTALLHLNDGRQSVRYLRAAVKIDPLNYTAKRLLLNALLDTANFEEALSLSIECQEAVPEDRDFMLSEAAALKGLMRPIDSLKVIDKILKVHRGDRVAYRLQADIFADSDSRLGIKLYKEILSSERNDHPEVQLRWNSCIHFLRARDFEEGWKNWELGFHKDVGTMGRQIPAQLRESPRAEDNPPKAGNWTLVCAEQGIGDQVLFLSALNDYIKEYKNVIVAAEHRMVSIIKRAFPEAHVTTPGIVEAWRKLPLKKQGWTPMGSLLPRYRKQPSDFAANRIPFLSVDSDKLIHYKTLIQEKANGRPVIGISWRGGYWELQQATKAMTLADWGAITRGNVLCVNLQYGDVAAELDAERNRGASILDFPKLDFKRDLEDWIAIAGACDGIISVSTALIHFAGAIGQKVGVVMPEPQGPWHLGVDDTWHLVYPNVFIFRRGIDETDESLVDRVSRSIVS